MSEHTENHEEYPDLRPFDWCPFCHRQPKPEDFQPQVDDFQSYLHNHFYNDGREPRGTKFDQLKQTALNSYNIRDAEYAHRIISNAYKTAVERTKYEYKSIRQNFCATVGIDESRLEVHWVLDSPHNQSEIIIHLQREINLYTMLLARLDKESD